MTIEDATPIYLERRRPDPWTLWIGETWTHFTAAGDLYSALDMATAYLAVVHGTAVTWSHNAAEARYDAATRERYVGQPLEGNASDLLQWLRSR